MAINVILEINQIWHVPDEITKKSQIARKIVGMETESNNEYITWSHVGFGLIYWSTQEKFVQWIKTVGAVCALHGEESRITECMKSAVLRLNHPRKI